MTDNLLVLQYFYTPVSNFYSIIVADQDETNRTPQGEKQQENRRESWEKNMLH